MGYKTVNTATAATDMATSYLALMLVAIILLSSLHQNSSGFNVDSEPTMVEGKKQSTFTGRPCDEIYVVGEGETLHTIIDKCGDPFIVEQNPHINEPDDIFPGIVIKITPSAASKKR